MRTERRPVLNIVRRSAIPFVVLVVGFLTTALTAMYAERSAAARDALRFQASAQQVVAAIGGRVDTCIALLRAGAGLFAADLDVSQRQFTDFVALLDPQRHYPGTQGIGFAVRLQAANLAAFTAHANTLHPGFTVWPGTPRPVYFPIVYLEPQDRRNQAALGYDMFTEPVRHEAMDRAARTGRVAMTGRVTLVQEIDPEKQAGFLVYIPVYLDGGTAPRPDADPISQLRGFIYSPFRADDFLSAIFASERESLVRLRLYDETVQDGNLLFDSHRGMQEPPRFSTTLSIPVAGRTWLARIDSVAAFEAAAERRFLPWIVAVGLVVTILLSGATWQEVRARAVAEATAEQLRRSEEALRESESRLRLLVDAERKASLAASAASRAKDEFLATLSHELRTPLNAILGWATMLKSGRLSGEQRERAVQVIARNAQTQADLIEDLLDVSRIITGKMRVDLQPAYLFGPVQAALDAVRPSAEAKRITLVRRFETDGPIIGDADRLQQVAWNLLSNAIKFTPEGGRVTVRLEQCDSHVELQVSDTGAGIDPAFLPHVFERFRQSDSSTTREHGGMGLGLAIARHLVEAHGGTVHAESDGPGKGSTFVVRLPLRPGTRPLEPGAHRAAWGQGREPDLGGRQVLVVDDEEDSRDLLAGILKGAGATVVTAGSAGEAVSILEEEGADLLLADIAMPGTDGYRLLEQVRHHPSERVRGVPAIAVTAHARAEDRDTALRAGFQGHVSKPLDIGVLFASIERAIRRE